MACLCAGDGYKECWVCERKDRIESLQWLGFLGGTEYVKVAEVGL